MRKIYSEPEMQLLSLIYLLGIYAYFYHLEGAKTNQCKICTCEKAGAFVLAVSLAPLRMFGLHIVDTGIPVAALLYNSNILDIRTSYTQAV
jgi:hypothetical protein